ncbi:Gfo/Idh/MocA family oxidoreductase [Amylibacter sp.]|nr:Gfo/Idh/MocA family oxidoreductase [Amylibacter sp.]
MTSSPIINIAVLGAASIALRSVIPAINLLPNHFRLVGISSRDRSKMERISSSYECKAYGTYESLLTEGSIDAIYIPLPNALHYPFVKRALENGKHVLVEKSLGCTLDEVEELVEIAKINNLVLFENFQFRFHSQLSSILQIIKDGTIGDLRSMKVAFGFPPFPDPNNIRYSAELGGGALLDAGAYAMKIAPFFLGNDIFVTQASSAHDQIKGVDIWGGGVVQQRNGPLFCHFSYGFDHYYQCSLELWGSIGKLTTNRIFTAPVGYIPKLIIETQNVVKEFCLSEDDQFKNMLEHFYSLITGSESVLMEYEQNVQQANLIHEFKQLAEHN